MVAREVRIVYDTGAMLKKVPPFASKLPRVPWAPTASPRESGWLLLCLYEQIDRRWHTVAMGFPR